MKNEVSEVGMLRDSRKRLTQPASRYLLIQFMSFKNLTILLSGVFDNGQGSDTHTGAGRKTHIC